DASSVQADAFHATAANGFAGKFTGKVSVLNGNVGIGTPTADRPLTVLGTSGTYINIKGDNGNEEILLGADSAGGFLSTMTNHDLQLRSGGNVTRVIIQAIGNVIPNSDSSQWLGDAAHRWAYVFSTNGVLTTSDARLKQRVSDLGYGLASVMKLRPIS